MCTYETFDPVNFFEVMGYQIFKEVLHGLLWLVPIKAL